MDFVFSKPLGGRDMEEACVFSTIDCIFDFATPTPKRDFFFYCFLQERDDNSSGAKLRAGQRSKFL